MFPEGNSIISQRYILQENRNRKDLRCYLILFYFVEEFKNLSTRTSCLYVVYAYVCVLCAYHVTSNRLKNANECLNCLWTWFIRIPKYVTNVSKYETWFSSLLRVPCNHVTMYMYACMYVTQMPYASCKQANGGHEAILCYCIQVSNLRLKMKQENCVSNYKIACFSAAIVVNDKNSLTLSQRCNIIVN